MIKPHNNYGTQVGRIALIADIHGNKEALDIVLEDIEKQHCERTICLGDVIDGGDDDAEVASCIMTLDIPCVRGNHDEWPPLTLPENIRSFLTKLPEDIIEQDIHFTHISPRQKKLPISNEIEAWNVFNETEHRLTFVGHLHFPAIFGSKSPFSYTASKHDFSYNHTFSLNRDEQYIICPGPVGYCRDGEKKIRYAIYDHRQNTIEIKALNGPLLALSS